MAVRSIRFFGDPVLKTPCDAVSERTDRVRGLIDDLIDTVQLDGRAGVAANQIGVGLRAFSYRVDGITGYVINPVLVEVSGEPVPVGEGCLSVPGLWFEVLRYPHAKVVGEDLDGNELVIEGDGLLAQALQHETDHLDGKLYLDRLSRDDRGRALKAIRESEWF